jgi:hypothetical protein
MGSTNFDAGEREKSSAIDRAASESCPPNS